MILRANDLLIALAFLLSSPKSAYSLKADREMLLRSSLCDAAQLSKR